MNRLKKMGLSFFYLLFSIGLLAQVTIGVDYSVQKYIGEISELDRAKYINIHANANDADMVNFQSDYNVGQGRFFWGPFSDKSQPVGSYPPLIGGGNGIAKPTVRKVATDHPRNVIRYNLDPTLAAPYVVDYYKNKAGSSIPEYFELMNEPFVHSGDQELGTPPSKSDEMKKQMAAWYAVIGKAIKESPELANMKVIGYSDAWPSMEKWGFGHWNNNMKMFMDTAGQYMDAFAIHLYDGENVTSEDNFRAGSNMEAILDLVETYSYYKWDTVKPLAITEYGGIVEVPESVVGWEPHYNAQGNIGNHNIIMGLLDREDRMEISIPFTTDKSTWHIKDTNDCLPYGPVLWTPSNIGVCPPAGPWSYTPRIHFYDIWKEISGKRVLIKSDNPDVLAHAFVNGNKLYIVLTNLDDGEHDVNLHYASDFGAVTNVLTKSLKTYEDRMPDYTETNNATAPKSITLLPDEAVSLEYEFSTTIEFENQIRAKNYYNKSHLVDIGGFKTFNFNGIDLGVGSGYATLRLSVGIPKNPGSVVQPIPAIITVNGTNVTPPENWRGYDQAPREDFFGTIEIPIPFNLLKVNNEIQFFHAKAGGKISSVILQTELFDDEYTGSVHTSDVFDDNSQFKVYPTIVKTGFFKVSLRNNHGYRQLSVTTLDGKKVKQIQIQKDDLNITVSTADLPKGVYFVNFLTNNSNTVQRIIVM